MSVDQSKETERNSRDMAETRQSTDMGRCRSWSPHKSSLKISGLNMSAVMRTWADMSKINFLPFAASMGDSVSTPSLWRSSTQRIRSSNYLIPDFAAEEESLIEQFAVNVTPLMNEGQLWRCFYIFPELYSDVYSPVVRIRQLEDVAEIIGGMLTRDMVSACLSYLCRTPILGDFVYIKLDLSSKHLMNIDVLQNYKYIVYLDLSSNYVSDLTVLSFLPYLQWLSVAFNRLSTVLEYETPQWFLTEVHYKYNSVKKIRDISMFWSITILDLSHNNIKYISGLENMQFLRRLDLSFNHIQRLENLNHLRLLWLDVSYNNISSFEYGAESGLWTLLHLEYLNLNENNLMSLKILSGCTRLRELHARNNRLSTLLELAVYMRQIRLLTELDLRANPICAAPAYKEVVINTFPRLLRLDAVMLDPVVQRSLMMQMTPDVNAFAVRRLLRLLYIEQLSRAVVSPFVPPADTTEVPLVVLVGYEALGKGGLVRRLVTECGDHVEHAWLHTTAPYHYINHYKEMPRKRFDDMLLAGDFLTYGEIDGESYGLSRKEAYTNPGKIKLIAMDLLPALMLKHRGRRPYLLLATTAKSSSLLTLQEERKQVRMRLRHMRLSAEAPMEKSTLQVLLSGRILITGILNEILMAFPEEKEQSEFIVTSQCSLFMESDARQTIESFAKGFNMMQLLNSNTSSLEDVCDRAYARNMQNESSLHSLYKESQITDEYCSNRTGQSFQKSDKDSRDQEKESTDVEKDSRDTAQDPRDTEKEPQESQEHVKDKSHIKPDKWSDLSHPKSAVDFSRYVSSTWKGLTSTKSSKSVTFTSQDNQQQQQKIVSMHEVHKDLSGELIQPPISDGTEVGADKRQDMRSVSSKMPWPTAPTHVQRTSSGASAKSTDDVDLWLAFLTETGLLQASMPCFESYIGAAQTRHETLDPQLIIEQLGLYSKPSNVTTTTNIRDDYDDVHRNYPGLFWDTVLMDNPDAAFAKVKKIMQNIVKSQSTQAPMFEIDFAELDYPSVKKRMKRLQDQLTPKRVLF